MPRLETPPVDDDGPSVSPGRAPGVREVMVFLNDQAHHRQMAVEAFALDPTRPDATSAREIRMMKQAARIMQVLDMYADVRKAVFAKMRAMGESTGDGDAG